MRDKNDPISTVVTAAELLETINIVQSKLQPKYNTIKAQLEELKSTLFKQSWSWFPQLTDDPTVVDRVKDALENSVKTLPAVFKLFVFLRTGSTNINKSILFDYVITFLARQQYPLGIDRATRCYEDRLAEYVSKLKQNKTYVKLSTDLGYTFPAFPTNGGTRRKRRKRVSRKYYF